MFGANSFEVFKKGHKTILLILSNLKREPNNPRFAKIAMTNATYVLLFIFLFFAGASASATDFFLDLIGLVLLHVENPASAVP